MKKTPRQSKSRVAGAPMVAGVITGGLRLQTVRKAVAAGADILELRVDTFARRDIPHLVSLLEKVNACGALKGVKILLTVRGIKEGGAVRISGRERVALYDALMPYADFADIEISARNVLKNVVDFARRDKVTLVVSYHNFSSTPGPGKLRSIIKKARSLGADIVKVATFVRRSGDIISLARVLAGSKDLIVIGMGEVGAPTRIFFPMIGSLVTYGAVSGRGTAPGQFPLSAIKKEFKRYGL